MPYLSARPSEASALTTSTPTSSAGGRPRDAVREGQILATVLEMLADTGYDSITFEEVARRAKASKATLYRRWPTKRDMVVAAVKAGPSSGHTQDAIDTGSLRGDLLALCHRLNNTLRASDGSMSLMLLQAGLEDAELCEYLEAATGPTGARLPAPVLEAAIARGELPAGAKPFPYEEVTGSVLLLRRLNGLTVDHAYLETLIDSILIPALAASAASLSEPPRGIFSGAPASD
ncbi:TetR/AcrR family transcriptional regulator [Leifsonia sp. ALI-44-B]|uniref:TetR/AcrR family transcriptional regulator n=1 Tax=Leifsonia sp. ALI-44-B TaxID=1933776 RepID=UPI001EE76D86|nr:TetR/AcrR family transcriptional regulator [Leifsonia sp. ALI-44-B]